MPMSSNPHTSMFPRYDFDLSADKEYCRTEYKVNPRPEWITTEFGGKVRRHCDIYLFIYYFYLKILQHDDLACVASWAIVHPVL